MGSAFVKDNKDSGCIIHEFNIGEDAEDVDDDCDCNCKNCSCSDISDDSHKNITFDKDENGNIHGFTSVKSDVNGYEKREFYSSKPMEDYLICLILFFKYLECVVYAAHSFCILS